MSKSMVYLQVVQLSGGHAVALQIQEAEFGIKSNYKGWGRMKRDLEKITILYTFHRLTPTNTAMRAVDGWAELQGQVGI